MQAELVCLFISFRGDSVKKHLWWVLIIVFVFTEAVLFCVWDNRVECCLCNSIPHHAPLLLNLATGETLELSVYDAHPFRSGELAEEQTTGYFCLIKGAGASGYREGGKYAKVTLSIEKGRINTSVFCRKCRKLLEGCHGYALVDLLNPSDLRVYSMTANEFELRNYTISIIANELQYEVTVRGIK